MLFFNLQFLFKVGKANQLVQKNADHNINLSLKTKGGGNNSRPVMIKCLLLVDRFISLNVTNYLILWHCHLLLQFFFYFCKH